MHYYTKKLIQRTLLDPLGTLYRFMEWGTRDPNAVGQVDSNAIRNGVMLLNGSEAERYKDEIEFLKSQPADYLLHSVFPYPRVKDSGCYGVFFDKLSKLPYVIHNKCRLYFPKHYTNDQIVWLYQGYLENEGLLGTGCLSKTPHAYVDSGHFVEQGDVVVDVGCAEALFALHHVDLCSEAFVFEGEKIWRKPLNATFSPYNDKVRVVNEYVGKSGVNLSSALPLDLNLHYFIKMDIEGAERLVLADIKEFLVTHKVKLSCCVYHRQDDEIYIVDFLKSLGFSCRFSDGYMLPYIGGVNFPFFRHGVVYARNF